MGCSGCQKPPCPCPGGAGITWEQTPLAHSRGVQPPRPARPAGYRVIETLVSVPSAQQGSYLPRTPSLDLLSCPVSLPHLALVMPRDNFGTNPVSFRTPFTPGSSPSQTHMHPIPTLLLTNCVALGSFVDLPGYLCNGVWRELKTVLVRV